MICDGVWGGDGKPQDSSHRVVGLSDVPKCRATETNVARSNRANSVFSKQSMCTPDVCSCDCHLQLGGRTVCESCKEKFPVSDSRNDSVVDKHGESTIKQCPNVGSNPTHSNSQSPDVISEPRQKRYE